MQCTITTTTTCSCSIGLPQAVHLTVFNILHNHTDSARYEYVMEKKDEMLYGFKTNATYMNILAIWLLQHCLQWKEPCGYMYVQSQFK